MTQVVKAPTDGRLAAWRIAEETQNPLTPIQLSAQRLRKRYLGKLQEDGIVSDECTRMIVKQVDELKGMVHEFSNLEPLPASTPAPNRLNGLIEETLALVKAPTRSSSFTSRWRIFPSSSSTETR